MNDKKKKLTMIGLSIFALAIVTLGTYALWSQISTTRENTISTGQVKMSYTEVNELTLNNALPMKDEDGKKQTNYFDFKVLSYIKTNANDNTKRKLNYNVILEPLTVTNALSNNEVKVYLTKIENGVETEVITPTTIDKLNNYILKSQEETFSNNKGEVTTSYRIRTWIDYDVNPDKFNNNSYSYKFRVNVNNEGAPALDTSGANEPVLTENMIPVYYDNTSSSWKKADSSNTNETYKWYDYDNKMWANAVTVTETNRSTYLSANAGTEINMNDINTMWVWIPRYTYTYLNTNTPEEIKIKFESGTESTGTIKCTDAVTGGSTTTSQTCTDTTNGSLKSGTSTYTHPAFTFGDTELTGLWVGKFESSATEIPTSSSTTESTVIIKPNVQSLRYKKVSYQFRDARQMERANNVYGFPQSNSTTFNWNGNLTGDNNNIDIHMMRNIEWGAVTYLYHSKYGRCTNGTCEELTINNCSTYTTGIGADEVSASSSSTTCTTDKNKYNGESGVKASTTGNVYGVYDISGGSYEYTMGNMVNSSNQFYTSRAENWSTTTTPLAKYYDSYTYNTSSTTYTRGRLGDAIVEMAPRGAVGNWYSDEANFPYSAYSWFIRGGNYNFGKYAGAFNFKQIYGFAGSDDSFRASLGAQAS